MPDDALSDEDKRLFQEAMRLVKPLHQSTKREPAAKSSVNEMRVRKKSPVYPTQPRASQFLSDDYAHLVQAETILSYTLHRIPQKRSNQLKSRQIPLEARLDLHGLKVDDARDALCRFIEAQKQLNHRCALIIHGKGSRQGEAPVLKNLVNHWLRQLPDVLAFHSALSQDGGAGALYVLLRKKIHPL